MSQTGSVNRHSQRHEEMLAFTSKLTALLGLAALGFLLTSPAMTLVSWVVILVAVIQFSLACSPGTVSAPSRKAVPVRSMDSYRYPVNSSFRRRTLSSKED